MRLRAIVLVGVLLLGAAACAKKESSSAAAGKGAAATAATAAPATPPVVHFTAKDFSFEGPDTIASGMTTVVLHNDGPSLHQVLFVRLDSGKTVADLEAAYKHMPSGESIPPAWAVLSGGVNPPMPGSDAEATLMIQPGNYAITCLVDAPGHVMHVLRGMIKALTVVPSKEPSAPAPKSDLTLTEVNFAFSFSAKPTAGHHVIEVENKGTQPHEFELVKLGPGKTMADLMKWGQTFEGPLPGISLGGAAPMVPGDVEYVPMDLTPGNYVALCFVMDPVKHIPHLAEGMILPFTIS